jgi:hypothetical protein
MEPWGGAAPLGPDHVGNDTEERIECGARDIRDALLPRATADDKAARITVHAQFLDGRILEEGQERAGGLGE